MAAADASAPFLQLQASSRRLLQNSSLVCPNWCIFNSCICNLISADSDTWHNEDDEERVNQLHHNEVRADMRRNEAAIRQSEHEM